MLVASVIAAAVVYLLLGVGVNRVFGACRQARHQQTPERGAFEDPVLQAVGVATWPVGVLMTAFSGISCVPLAAASEEGA